MTLISDWRHAWRFFSVVLATALGVANVIHANSDLLSALFPPKTWAVINALVCVAIGVGRVLQQQIPARDCAPPPAAPASPKES